MEKVVHGSRVLLHGVVEILNRLDNRRLVVPGLHAAREEDLCERQKPVDVHVRAVRRGRELERHLRWVCVEDGRGGGRTTG